MIKALRKWNYSYAKSGCKCKDCQDRIKNEFMYFVPKSEITKLFNEAITKRGK